MSIHTGPGRPDWAITEGVADHLRQLGNVAHQIVMFGDGDRDAVGVHFLEGVGTDHRGRYLTGDADQRESNQAGIGDRRHQVRRPRAAAGYRPPACLRYAPSLGDKARALLVARQDVADLRALA